MPRTTYTVTITPDRERPTETHTPAPYPTRAEAIEFAGAEVESGAHRAVVRRDDTGAVVYTYTHPVDRLLAYINAGAPGIDNRAARRLRIYTAYVPGEAPRVISIAPWTSPREERARVAALYHVPASRVRIYPV